MVKPLPQPESTNARGIPQAPFLGAVDEYASTEEEAAGLLGKLQEMLNRLAGFPLKRKRRLSVLLRDLTSTSFCLARWHPVSTRWTM